MKQNRAIEVDDGELAPTGILGEIAALVGLRSKSRYDKQDAIDDEQAEREENMEKLYAIVKEISSHSLLVASPRHRCDRQLCNVDKMFHINRGDRQLGLDVLISDQRRISFTYWVMDADERAGFYMVHPKREHMTLHMVQQLIVSSVAEAAEIAQHARATYDFCHIVREGKADLTLYQNDTWEADNPEKRRPKLTKAMSEVYVNKNEGQRCPYCEAKQVLTGKKITDTAIKTERIARCNVCKKQWLDVFELVRAQPYGEEENEESTG